MELSLFANRQNDAGILFNKERKDVVIINLTSSLMVINGDNRLRISAHVLVVELGRRSRPITLLTIGASVPTVHTKVEEHKKSIMKSTF